MVYPFYLLDMFNRLLFLLFSSVLAISAFSIDRGAIAKQFEILKDENVSDEEKMKVNKQLQDSLYALISSEDKVLGRLYSEFPNLGRAISDDKKLCVYSWGFSLSDKTYYYGSIVQSLKRRKVRTSVLKMKNGPYIPRDDMRIAHDNWYGSLYYSLIHVKFKRDEYYTLIGWSKNAPDSQFKVLDAARLDSKGRLNFGKMAFKQKGKPARYRYLLQYDANGRIAVNYDPGQHSIIFDHLAPESVMFTDIYSYYGPDFTYDAFEVVDGKWVLRQNVDAKNKQ